MLDESLREKHREEEEAEDRKERQRQAGEALPGWIDREDRSRDWDCENCGTSNFARRGICRRCRGSRPSNQRWQEQIQQRLRCEMQEGTGQRPNDLSVSQEREIRELTEIVRRLEQ